MSYLLHGIIPLEKEISLVTPDDYNSLNLNAIYEGTLNDFVSSNAACFNI